MNAAQKFNPDHDSVSMAQVAFQLRPVDDNMLETLLTDVTLHSLGAFEQIHAILYPLTFSYASLFSIDNETVDRLLVDEFLYCWKNSRFTSGRELKIGLIRRLRSKIIVILNIERKQNGIIPGRGESSQVVPQLLEDEFLKRFLRLSDEDIAQINCKNAA